MTKPGVCPKCQSTVVTMTGRPLGGPNWRPGPDITRSHCDACGHEWTTYPDRVIGVAKPVYSAAPDTLVVNATKPALEMVRYGRGDNNRACSVLYTLKVDEVVYWGISRCGPKDDFDKERGLFIATNRAHQMAHQYNALQTPDRQEVSLHNYQSWLSNVSVGNYRPHLRKGYIYAKDVGLLVKYFRSLPKPSVRKCQNENNQMTQMTTITVTVSEKTKKLLQELLQTLS